MSRGDNRPKMLNAGRELMLARGYSATSIDDVCSAAGVSKGSFYHFFESKEEFGLVVLEDYYERGLARLKDGGYVRVEDPLERLHGFLDHLEEIAPHLWRHGCLLGSFAAELGESSPAIHSRVGEMFDRLVSSVAPLFAALEPDPDERTALAEEMLAQLEGSVILARAHRDPERIVEGARRFRRNLEARTGEALGGSR